MHILRVLQELHCYKMLVYGAPCCAVFDWLHSSATYCTSMCRIVYTADEARDDSNSTLHVAPVTTTQHKLHRHKHTQTFDSQISDRQPVKVNAHAYHCIELPNRRGIMERGLGCLCLPVCVSLQSLHILCAWFQFEGMLWSAKSWHSSVLSSYESGGISDA